MAEGGFTSRRTKVVDKLTQSVSTLTVKDVTDRMNFNTLKDTFMKQKQERLQHDVLTFLKKRGVDGVRRNVFWNDLGKFTGVRGGGYRATDYGLIRLKDMIEIHMKNEIEMFTPSKGLAARNEVFYRLKTASEAGKSVEPDFAEDDFPPPSTCAKASTGPSKQSSEYTDFATEQTGPPIQQRRGSSNSDILPLDQVVDLTDQNSQGSEDLEIVESYQENKSDALGLNLSTEQLKILESDLVQFLSTKRSGVKMSILTYEVFGKTLRKFQLKMRFTVTTVYHYLKEQFPHLLEFFNMKKEKAVKKCHVKLKDGYLGNSGNQESSQNQGMSQNTTHNAMSLMSTLSGWGKPATATTSRLSENMSNSVENTNQNANKKPVPSEQFISLVDDDEEKKGGVQVIEIPDEVESPAPGTSWANIGQAAPVQVTMPTIWLNPTLNVPGMPQQMMVNNTGQLPAYLFPSKDQRPVQLEPGNTLVQKPNNNPFMKMRGGRTDPSLPGFRDEVIDLTAKPIDQQLFEPKAIDVRPVFVPRGQGPSRDFVNQIAQECIDTLSEADEYVTIERVEKLICQRFQCPYFRQLGVGYPDQIPSINELNRQVNKINTYILGFIKTRAICTLHELKEALRDYVPNKEDFSNLKLGPLQRFPVVYQQFRFPPDFATIPEITSMDILDHFHNYLSKFGLWTKRLELEPFMDYLVGEYRADNAYMLGVRIRSLPLAAGVLKKAQRDTGNSIRDIVEHFKTNLRNDVGDAFRKFRASMLQTGEGEGFEVRSHYLKMRPELTILEIMEKFNLLLITTQMGLKTTGAPTKLRKVLESFVSVFRGDMLALDLLHLAICMSSTALEESAMALMQPAQVDTSGYDTEGATGISDKPPPQKDSLIAKLKMYIERCLNAGTLSLTHLDRIEQKLLEDFEFSTFNMMGYGRFLEFLLSEAKQMIEEGGGLLLGGSAGHSDSDVSFKPQQNDIIDFIKQCRQCGHTQPSEIEDALCHQYGVKEVRLLGYGNITRLLSHADKHSRHMYGELTVIYESTLTPAAGVSASSGSKIGILGHQTRDAAKICLHNCPLLEDLASWSQWELVFEPELGKLKDFVQKYGSITNKTLEGGRMATLDFMALELRPGHMIKIVSTTSPKHFAAALERRDPLLTSGHLVSMAVSHKGVNNMPLALLTSHMKTTLLQLHAGESSDEEETAGRENAAAMFILQCLLRIPTKLCVALANQIFLDPLGQVIGSNKSKHVLVELCKSVVELNQLIELGCLLGIQEWTGMIQQKCVLPDSAVQIISPDVEEYLETEPQEQEEEETVSSDESDTEDVDEILAGDLEEVKEVKDTDKVKDSAKVTDEAGERDQDEQKQSADHTDESDSKTGEDGNEDVVMEVETTVDDVKPVTCEDIVNDIRRDEFGIGIHLSEDGQRLMKVQQERLGRSLDRLSKDLYSKDTHFVLELVQNADDNSYHDNLLDNSTDDCPAVKFVINQEGITVMNNENGFREKDIRALCDVGRSTKGKHKFGYIGQKGIGFKSVFRVTDAPEVHSNGYHIQFDVTSGPMGYILPHWLTDTTQYPADEWMTHIMLKLKSDMRLQTRTLAARFNDIHPSLLLFLHRLRKITIENKVENAVQTMRRRDMGDSIVEIEHTHGLERWFVVKKMLDATKISQQAKSGAEVESTEIAIAFPIKQQGQKLALMQLPPKQPVFAFLPLRSYGFRFIVQGDFDVPSSREDVDRDSSWNQWLRNEIHSLFLDSLDVFKGHKEFSTMEAVCVFLQFVPMEDEVLDFFKPVASDILKKLKAKPCVPTQPNSQGVVNWKMPSQTVRVRDPLVRSVITADLLQIHLNLYYLHGDVAAMLNPTLTSCLGIETLTSEHLFQLGKALIVDMGTHCGSDTDVVLIARWLACMYRSLDEFQEDDSVLTTMKSQRLLPLSTGELVSLQEKTVFYPIPDSSTDRQNKRDPLFYLQQDVNSLHPLLLHTGDSEVDSQVHKLMMRLGIKQLSPFDVINHHIIPVLKADTWKEKSPNVLVSYLIYIKEQTEKQVSVCNLDDLKDVAMVMTNQGLKNPKQTPVHFPPQYGNQIELQKLFAGYEWTLLDVCYLPTPLTQTTVISWHNFFSKLGVEDFLSVRQTDVTVRRENLAKSVWSGQCELWPTNETEFTIKDYSSVELETLVKHNKYHQGNAEGVSHMFADQMRALCVLLDKNWENSYSRYCVTNVLDKDGKVLKETETSFSIILKTVAWLPALEYHSSVSLNGIVNKSCKVVLKDPSRLYLRSPIVEKLLSDKVLYLDVVITGGSFHQHLGIKNSVAVETVKEYLLRWGEREKDETATVLCTSLEHMKNVYAFLSGELKLQEFQDLLRQKPVIFVPDKTSLYKGLNSDVVAGKLLNKQEVWISDKTGLFDKHRALLEEYHSDICRKRTIAGYYSDRPDILELFRQQGKLDSQPKVDEYIELLTLMCTSGTPKDTNVLSDTLYIFTTIGQALVDRPEGMPDSQTADMVLEGIKATVKKKLFRPKVFPTKDKRWVSVSDRPLIADNREWEAMFTGKTAVYFLDMEERDRGSQQGRGAKNSQRHPRGRDIETRIQPDMINVVIETCGIKKLSEVVDPRPAPEMIEPCHKLQGYFHRIVPHVQQYLMTRFEDVYQQLDQINTREMLGDAKFYQTKKLEVTYWLKDRTEETFVVHEEKCVIQPPTFYFHENHLESVGEINKEVARYFSQGNMPCNTALRSFLSELNNILSSVTYETVDQLLQRHDADGNMEITDEEAWHVEAPPQPKPVLIQLPEPEPEPMYEEVQQTYSADGTSSDTPVMRAWPPVADNSKIKPPRERNEQSSSNIWPPPQAKDYMQSVKNLPSNIRVVADDKKDGAPADGETESKQGGNSSSESKGDNSGTGKASSENSVLGDSTGKGQDHVHTGGTVSGQPGVGSGGATDHVAHNLPSGSGTGDQDFKRKRTLSDEGGAQHTKRHSANDLPTDDGVRSEDQRENTGTGKRNMYRFPQQVYQASHTDGQKRFKRMGDPIWTYMATDYSYDDLGSGMQLNLPITTTLNEEAADPEIGQWGEELVSQYLERQKGMGNIIDFVWKNGDEESGCPFDFEVHFATEEGIQTDFIEVKSTVSDDKEVFEISVQQIKCADEKGHNFHIFRVFNAGNMEKVRLIRITDLNMRLSQKQVKLCMLI